MYDPKCIWVFMRSTCYSCEILTKIEISVHVFEKYSNFKIPENPFNGSRVVPCGRTESRRTDMTNVIVTFYDLANTPKMFITVFFKPAS
jgi:hypothetical protein